MDAGRLTWCDERLQALAAKYTEGGRVVYVAMNSGIQEAEAFLDAGQT
ncbi:MAG: hypothetical protein ACK2UO_01730 [Caldilineaceae bacterium]